MFQQKRKGLVDYEQVELNYMLPVTVGICKLSYSLLVLERHRGTKKNQR